MVLDGRLTRMLHMLLHIHLHDGAATSQTIAQMLNTNPVVVRRMMAGLRDRGYVIAIKGPGGGWRLGRRLKDITVLEVYEAFESPPLFAMGITADHPTCPVERAVNAAVGKVLSEAEAQVLARFGAMSLADVAIDLLAA